MIRYGLLLLAVIAAGTPASGQSICSSLFDNGFAYGGPGCGATAGGLEVPRPVTFYLRYQYQNFFSGPVVSTTEIQPQISEARGTCGVAGFECRPVVNANNNIDTASNQHSWRGFSLDGRYLAGSMACAGGILRDVSVTRPVVTCQQGPCPP